MKAVVMAGGEGSLLRPLTSRRPKPLVPVAGRPIMEHILTLLREHGITEVVVTLQYLGSEIRNYFGDGSEVGLDIHYVVEEHPLGTAGSVRNAAELLDDTFLVISGDALTDFDLSWVIAQHREKGAMATIVLHGVPNPLEYGVVITEPDGAVRRFLEKPSWGEVFSDQANTGIYVIEPPVLNYIKPGVAYDWSQDVFPTMLRKRDPLYGVVPEGYWCDVGTVQSYLQANWDALQGRVRCQISGRRDGDVWVGEGVEFGLHVRIDGPVYIGSDAKIKAGAFINGPVVIDKYTVIDDNAKVSNSVLWQHSYVGENCRLRQSIIGRNVTIKNNCLLEENTVVGDDCVIGEGSHIDAGVKLWPNKEIQTGSRVNESIIWAGEWRPGLFSSAGLTGLVNVELTPEYCARLGAAFAATHPKGATIAVTRDCARSSRMIKRALIAGIVSAGGRVLDRSELPVPVTQFACRLSGCAAGVHVLASPLDQRSADVRFFDSHGLPIDKRAERKVENLFFREDIRRVGFYEMGDIEYASPRPAYVDHVLAGVDADAIRAAELRVVVDYDYGAASLRGKGGDQDGQAERHDHRRSHPLDRARRNQQGRGWCQRARGRCGGKQNQPADEDPAPAEAVAERRRRDDAGGEGQGERIDGPLQHRQAGMQVSLDGGQRGHDHECIERDHEERDGGQSERPDRTGSAGRRVLNHHLAEFLLHVRQASDLKRI